MTDTSVSPRYVVCGSRDWPQDRLWFVSEMMIELIPYRAAVVVTGGAHGVDDWADNEAIRLGWERLVMPADWDKHGKRAGYLRNLAMLDLQPSAVLAFQWNGSKGTGHTIREAYKRGITLHHFTQDSLRPDIAALDMGDVE